MVLKMARCIGRSGCDGAPGARGLCTACYMRHRDRGTISNFPTMTERTRALRAHDWVPAPARGNDAQRAWRAARYAERVELEGHLVHPVERHGYTHTYTTYGCRGPMCRASQGHYRRTGESALPDARVKNYTAVDCVLYRSNASDE